MRVFRNPFAIVFTALWLAAIAGCGGCTQEDPKGTNESGETPATNGGEQTASRPELQREPFGESPAGDPITRFILSNSNGMKVSVITYGAIITSVEVPDRKGNIQNVTLGFDSLDGYTENDPYFGAICGRYANRIAFGKFTLDGTEHQLSINTPPHHLHGGEMSFNEVIWTAQEVRENDLVGVTLTYVSEDGEEGYPGQLKADVTYTLNNDNELKIDYRATTDKTTIINLTSHCYWNLAGVETGGKADPVLDHELTLNCEQYLPVDETLIPTGELAPVEGTPMDFRQPKKIGADLAAVKGDNENGGYDHCYVVNGWMPNGEPRQIARLSDPGTGRVMEVLTTEPGVQLYTGNFLAGEPHQGGFAQHSAVCLECQHFPDSPNHPDFPSTVLNPAPEVYTQTTIYKFSVEE